MAVCRWGTRTRKSPHPPRKKKAKSWQLKLSKISICYNKNRPFIVKSSFEINLIINLKNLWRNNKKVGSLPNNPILFSLPAPPTQPQFLRLLKYVCFAFFFYFQTSQRCGDSLTIVFSARFKRKIWHHFDIRLFLQNWLINSKNLRKTCKRGKNNCQSAKQVKKWVKTW